MLWDLPHRGRDADESTSLQLEAPTSDAAIEAARAQIPDDHVLLYVRRID